MPHLPLSFSDRNTLPSLKSNDQLYQWVVGENPSLSAEVGVGKESRALACLLPSYVVLGLTPPGLGSLISTLKMVLLPSRVVLRIK